jgi:pimeloyl-ACP methyl ester carboxylesterase
MEPTTRMSSPIQFMRALLLAAALSAGTCAHAAEADGPEGSWVGALEVGINALTIGINISRTPSGGWAGTMDSPDQGAYGILLENVTFQNSRLRCEVPRIAGLYEADLLGDPRKLVGTWSQAGRTFPLTLLPGLPAAPNRPQEPTKPYPYDEEEVRYENPRANVKFAGSFTKPNFGGPFPAVLLITGSGPQDRNEEIMGHKPFLVLADDLTRRGIAVLRVDDRGVGGSGGNPATATTTDYIDDAFAAVSYLQSRKDVDRNRIGLIGHSEGALIAAALAARTRDVAFIVLLGGPGVTGAEILPRQNELISQVSGLPPALIEFNDKLMKEVIALLQAEPDDGAFTSKLDAVLRQRKAAVEEMKLSPAEQMFMNQTLQATSAQAKTLTSPWMRTFLAYDPRPVLEQVRCPVLVVNGSLDLQVPPDQNLPQIEAALRAGGNGSYRIERLAGLNHLLQKAGTGSPAEYGGIEQTIDPEALKMIGEWVTARIAPARTGANSIEPHRQIDRAHVLGQAAH